MSTFRLLNRYLSSLPSNIDYTMKTITLLLPVFPLGLAFAPFRTTHLSKIACKHQHGERQQGHHMIDQRRREQLRLADDDDEYDLGVALNTNTDAGITKIIAGSFILIMIALLVVGLM